MDIERAIKIIRRKTGSDLGHDRMHAGVLAEFATISDDEMRAVPFTTIWFAQQILLWEQNAQLSGGEFDLGHFNEHLSKIFDPKNPQNEAFFKAMCGADPSIEAIVKDMVSLEERAATPRPKIVPAFVEDVKGRFIAIGKLTERDADGGPTPEALALIQSAMHRCISELEQWRSCWQPVWEVTGVLDIEPVFVAIELARKQLGDKWPIDE